MALTPEQMARRNKLMADFPDDAAEIFRASKELSVEQETTLERSLSMLGEGFSSSLTMGFGGPDQPREGRNLVESGAGIAGHVLGTLPSLFVGGGVAGMATKAIAPRLGAVGARILGSPVSTRALRSGGAMGLQGAFSRQEGEKSILDQSAGPSLVSGVKGAVMGAGFGAISGLMDPVRSSVAESIVGGVNPSLLRYGIRPAVETAVGTAAGMAEGVSVQDALVQNAAM